MDTSSLILISLTILVDPKTALSLSSEQLNLIRSEEEKDEEINLDKLKIQASRIISEWINTTQTRISQIELAIIALQNR